MKVSMSKVLPDLLDEDETTALVDFVQHLRAQKEKNDGQNPYRMEPDDMESHRRLLDRFDRLRRLLRRSLRMALHPPSQCGDRGEVQRHSPAHHGGPPCLDRTVPFRRSSAVRATEGTAAADLVRQHTVGTSSPRPRH